MGCGPSGAARAGGPGGGGDAGDALESCLDVLYDAYGKPTTQIGYTDGHHCVTPDDRAAAAATASSLLYGEILAEGVTRVLDAEHLDAGGGAVLYDLGMGVGKLLMQAFLTAPSLRYVLGVELAASRYAIAEAAFLRLAGHARTVAVSAHVPMVMMRLTVSAARRPRVIEIRRGNMWAAGGLGSADVVVMHTEIPEAQVRAGPCMLSRAGLWHPQRIPGTILCSCVCLVVVRAPLG